MPHAGATFGLVAERERGQGGDYDTTEEDELYEIRCCRCPHKSRWHMRTPTRAVRDAKAEGRRPHLANGCAPNTGRCPGSPSWHKKFTALPPDGVLSTSPALGDDFDPWCNMLAVFAGHEREQISQWPWSAHDCVMRVRLGETTGTRKRRVAWARATRR